MPSDALGPQFGARDAYTGEPGEPDPESYTHYDDYVRDRRRWENARKQGKTADTSAVTELKRQVSAKERPQVEEGKAQERQVVRQVKRVNTTMDAVDKGLKALGVKKQRSALAKALNPPRKRKRLF